MKLGFMFHGGIMQVSGNAFKTLVEFAEKKYGSERTKNFYIDNSHFCRIKDFLDLDWYELDYYLEYSETVDKYFGFGDASILLEAGEYAAKKAFESSHSLFRDLSMQCALSNAEAVFLSFFSAAVAEIKYIKNNKAELYIKNLPLSPHLSNIICGWLKYSSRAIRTKEASIVEKNHKKNCLCFTLEWINC
jgi:hypothetical protein